MRKRVDTQAVWLTGCGWVTPAAHGSLDAVLLALDEASARTGDPKGPSGPRDGYLPIPDEWRERTADIGKELKADRGGWIAALALLDALRSARIEPAAINPARTGLVLGHGLAGQLGMIRFAEDVRAQSARFVSPIHFPQTVGNYLAGALARGFQLQGPNLTIANGCASGLDAVREASSIIANRKADVMIAGGVEPLTEPLAVGLHEADSENDGVASEGACFFMLESETAAQARSVQPLALVMVEEMPEDQADILSAAGTPRAGGIFIERWIGRCFGASGAAALAAALGAARGLKVPVAQSGGSDIRSERYTLPSADQESTGRPFMRARIQADGEGAIVSELGVTIPASE